MGSLGTLLLIFIVLKLVGLVVWSWFFVLIPLWIWIVCLVLAIIIVLVKGR